MRKFFGLRSALVAAALAVVGTQQFHSSALAESTTAKKDAQAGAKKGLELGDAAPEWTELEGIDGKKHSLVDLKEADAVAVIFTCNHCPVAKAYEERLVELDQNYKDKKVAIVAINVSNADADKLPAMKQRGEEKGFEFAYLYDPSQEIGRKFGAKVTPHAFLLDKERKLVYRGAIDDSQNAAKVTKHSLRDAIDAVLAGKAPAEPETKQFGCGIGYE
jgi:thiol-disulfide isomerase/thioredoxin